MLTWSTVHNPGDLKEQQLYLSMAFPGPVRVTETTHTSDLVVTSVTFTKHPLQWVLPLSLWKVEVLEE